MWRTSSLAVLWLLWGSSPALADPDIPTQSDVDEAESVARDVQDLVPGGVSPQTKKKLEIIDEIKDRVDLESTPFDDDDTLEAAKAAVDALDRDYETARAALNGISSTDQKKRRVKKATKFVDEFEAALSSWQALLDERNAEAAEN